MFNCPLEPTNIGKLFIINKFIEEIRFLENVNKIFLPGKNKFVKRRK